VRSFFWILPLKHPKKLTYHLVPPVPPVPEPILGITEPRVLEIPSARVSSNATQRGCSPWGPGRWSGEAGRREQGLSWSGLTPKHPNPNPKH